MIFRNLVVTTHDTGSRRTNYKRSRVTDNEIFKIDYGKFGRQGLILLL